jgi:hypothetical protein
LKKNYLATPALDGTKKKDEIQGTKICLKKNYLAMPVLDGTKKEDEIQGTISAWHTSDDHRTMDWLVI